MKMKLTVLLAVLLLAVLPLTALAANQVTDCPYPGCHSKADLIGYANKDAETHYCIYRCKAFPSIHVSSHTFTEAHNYNRQVAAPMYSASAPTCTEPAKFYKSCVCGAKGTETFDFGRPLGHVFVHYVSNGDATCLNDGTKTAVCARPGCEATHTITDKGSHLSVPHTYGNWYQNPHDKAGMLERDCKVCGQSDYRYVEPLQTKDFPIVKTLVDAAKEAKEGDEWFIVDSDKILTSEELESMGVLSPVEQVLVFTAVIGYEDQVNEVTAEAEPLSEEAAALKNSIQQRVAGLQGEDAAAFQNALDTYFPSQIIVLDPYGNDYDAKLLTVRVTSGGETRDEAYGFRRVHGEWSFGKL